MLVQEDHIRFEEWERLEAKVDQAQDRLVTCESNRDNYRNFLRIMYGGETALLEKLEEYKKLERN